MIGSTCARGSLRVPACLLALLVGLWTAVLTPGAAGADDGEVTRPLAPSNTALLARAAQGAARRLVAQVPLTPGTKVGLRSESNGDLDADMREALLHALNARRIACVLLPPGEGADTAAAARPTGPGGGGTGGTADGSAGLQPSTNPSGDLAAIAREAQGQPGSYDALQAERRAQAARADSIARAGGGGTATKPETVLATSAQLPVLTWRVQEARVDYVRVFRGGIFGAQRVERRARADLALRLAQPGTDAVTWSASADSTVGDVVLKSEIAALEDRTRPETRPTLPSNSFKKVIEPALVVILIAGLVSLFYQNRP